MLVLLTLILSLSEIVYVKACAAGEGWELYMINGREQQYRDTLKYGVNSVGYGVVTEATEYGAFKMSEDVFDSRNFNQVMATNTTSCLSWSMVEKVDGSAINASEAFMVGNIEGINITRSDGFFQTYPNYGGGQRCGYGDTSGYSSTYGPFYRDPFENIWGFMWSKYTLAKGYIFGDDCSSYQSYGATDYAWIWYGRTVTLATTSIPTESPSSSPTETPTSSPTTMPTESPTSSPTTLPSENPTSSPTTLPTEAPTEFCETYTNDVQDLTFLGAGSSCRGGINESWTGGRTCDSPYIICLPEENTPSIDMMEDRYMNVTHRYTVPECLRECSYDQRCMGVEFVADANSSFGDCNLIDSIPVVVEDAENIFNYYTGDHRNLDNSTTGGNVLCWGKSDYCNPFFEADDLNDGMLNCYCPNNRKGFYTKRVQRNVNNTRFCGNDSRVDVRIKKAQANRMFHLCENWCLFETFNPEEENWYYDPWQMCWRETYSGIGEHRSYCDRVIRNPDSIEFKFFNHRIEHFCGVSTPPTPQPVADTSTTWFLAHKLENCDDACSRNGLTCAADQTSTVFKTESDLLDAFMEAGISCFSATIHMNETDYVGWALPGLRGSNICANRQSTPSHFGNFHSDCNRKLGGNWQRLCACF